MSYSLGPFYDALPSHQLFEPLDYQGHGLYVARWPATAFKSLAEFEFFCWRYSCVMQPYICNPQRTDLEHWFEPDVNATLGPEPTTTTGSIGEWFKQHYPQITANWLHEGGPAEIIANETFGEYPEMRGRDRNGYYDVFAADQIG